MGGLYAGTSGWAYPSWRPGFYPAEVAPRRFLSHYAARLNTVEVNATFRRAATPAQVYGWLKEAAGNPAFRFSFKAPEQITHRLRLRECGGPWQAFVASLEPARAHTAAVLLQFPPNFRAESKGKDKVRNLEALRGFLEGIAVPDRPPLAVEFRDGSWFSDETFALLRQHGVALCWADADGLKTPRERTAGFFYLRLRESAYTPEQLAAEARTLRELAAAGDVFCYFKHEDEPHGPLRAEALLQG